jgi:hypothetical protein
MAAEAPSTPFSRSLTDFKGLTPTVDQYETGTCIAHSNARIVAHNVWEFIAPLEVRDVENYHAIFKKINCIFGNVGIVLGYDDTAGSAEAKLKVMLYALGFSLSYSNSSKAGSKTYSAEPIRDKRHRCDDPNNFSGLPVFLLLHKMLRFESVPTIPSRQGSMFDDYKRIFLERVIAEKYKWICLEIHGLGDWSDEYMRDTIFERCLFPILRCGLYVQLMSDSHALTIIGYDEEKSELIMRNSWFDPHPLGVRLRDFKFFHIFNLHNSFKSMMMVFVLPVTKRRNTKGYMNDRWYPTNTTRSRTTTSMMLRTEDEIEHMANFVSLYAPTFNLSGTPAPYFTRVSAIEATPEHGPPTAEKLAECEEASCALRRPDRALQFGQALEHETEPEPSPFREGGKKRTKRNWKRKRNKTR